MLICLFEVEGNAQSGHGPGEDSFHVIEQKEELTEEMEECEDYDEEQEIGMDMSY